MIVSVTSADRVMSVTVTVVVTIPVVCESMIVIVVRNCPGCNGYLVEVIVTTLNTGVIEDDEKIAAVGFVDSGSIDNGEVDVFTGGSAAVVGAAEGCVVGLAADTVAGDKGAAKDAGTGMELLDQAELRVLAIAVATGESTFVLDNGPGVAAEGAAEDAEAEKDLLNVGEPDAILAEAKVGFAASDDGTEKDVEFMAPNSVSA